ncbi:PEPxxWA-CTERM sorting domain-containing protein [Sphingomonas qilianensis]|uniref:PEPxxWA-CTERM sorting domain-containing protein n=1 Tax=Sphingomonas qilianensis TaxID=1736690 RepID=A0ABU9XTA3_9SPHN
MSILLIASRLSVIAFATLASSAAQAAYWNLFNREGENVATAVYATYNTFDDMLIDANRTGTYYPDTPGFGSNVVGTGSNGDIYWSLFNREEESVATSVYVTYATLGDMLVDNNRTGNYYPDAPGFGANVVGGGTDGKIYWNLFNREGENAATAVYVTYNSLADMLVDTNRTGNYYPDTPGFGSNVVGTGSNGDIYWSLFNREGEGVATAVYVTYSNLADMLVDTNRIGNYYPDTPGFGNNVVDGGSDVSSVPEPAAWTMLITGFGLTGALRRRERRKLAFR